MTLDSSTARTAPGGLIDVIPVGPALGAEVAAGDITAFDDWTAAAFMRALLRHQVLLLRRQRCSERDIARISARFGRADVLYTPYGVAVGERAGFTSLHAVHDALPSVLRRRVAPLKIRHLTDHGTVEPLLGLHPDTGRGVLALGTRHRACLVGVSAAESDALLDELWQLATSAEFTWVHHCQAGDLIISDPRCALRLRDRAVTALPHPLQRGEIWGTLTR